MRWGSTYIIDRKLTVGRWYLGISWRRSDGCMGRFGGGWNWKLGFQAGGSSVILSLLVLEVRIGRKHVR
jgi:hypothetical protein